MKSGIAAAQHSAACVLGSRMEADRKSEKREGSLTVRKYAQPEHEIENVSL